mmetsp:Transcript_7276/g.11621  ORF Transcript_7276/g.11621 Transcript_7276/m.11621 type:complete len:421 (-) Transcript_7276:66-1328(-)
MVRKVEKLVGLEELRVQTRAPSDRDEQEKRGVLKVLSGSCELFGNELFTNHEYVLQPNSSYGIFSWYGCEIEIDESFVEMSYTSNDTPMAEIAHIHSNLGIRSSAGKPPRVAIVGPSNCGKTSVARNLAAYAFRDGRAPVMVDLDVSKNNIGVPGTVAATVIDSDMTFFGDEGEVGFTARDPLMYYVGYDSVTGHAQRLQEQIKLLEAQISERGSRDGLIIDTFAWSKKGRTEKPLIEALTALKADIILVIGSDMLLSVIKSQLKTTTVVKVTRSGGVVEQDDRARKVYSSERFRNYFYGSRQQLSPFRTTVKLEDINIYLVRAKIVINDESIRPIGMEANDEEEKKVSQVKVLDPTLQNCILAVVHAEGEDDALTSNVAGFVHVAEVDSEAGEITFTTPCPGDLPSKVLVHGNLKWYET